MKLNRKNKFLLLGFVAAFYICYRFAIANTVHYYQEYTSKKELVTTGYNTPELAVQLHQKEKQLDELLSKYNISPSESFQNDLLKQLNFYSAKYSLKITDFKEPHIITENGFITSSYVFSLKGSFNGCLALLNKIENNPSLGTIKHIDFEKKRNYKSNSDELFVEVILQKSRGAK